MRFKFLNDFKPIFSILIIVSTLISLVVLKMEERRLGYELFQLSSQQRKLMEQKRMHEISLTKMTRPQYVQRVAETRLDLQQANQGQIIHLMGPNTEFTLVDQQQSWFLKSLQKLKSSEQVVQ
jgi:hypothetical protein